MCSSMWREFGLAGDWRSHASHVILLPSLRLSSSSSTGYSASSLATTSLPQAFTGILRVAQYSAYVRLFALWHVAHVPVLALLAVSAIVHGVAPLLAAFVPLLPFLFMSLDGAVVSAIVMTIGFLFILAISSLGVYGITLAGWASNNKYSVLGALRASAQLISYEIAMGLSAITVLIVICPCSLVLATPNLPREAIILTARTAGSAS